MYPRILVFLFVCAGLDAASNGVSGSEILIGQCAALKGPAEALGWGMNDAHKAAFEEINAKGGIHGRKLRLISEDDGYEPDKSVDCTGKMIEEKGVFALAGYVGTPTAKVVAPMVAEYKVPLVGLFTGATLLRDPVQRYVMNIRASYDDETEALVEYLTRNKPVRISVFYQNDSFGLSGLSGVENALARRKMTLASKGSFERNTLNVSSGLASVMAGNPEAVIVVAPYTPTAEFIKVAAQSGLKAKLATISFVGTESLISELGPASEGILISQVVPSPHGDAVLARAYRAALKTASPAAKPSFVSFEGYIGGRVLAAAIDQAGQDLSREKLIDAFHAMSKLDLDGMSISFSERNHQGSKAVFLTAVKDGQAQQVP